MSRDIEKNKDLMVYVLALALENAPDWRRHAEAAFKTRAALMDEKDSIVDAETLRVQVERE